MGRITGQSIGIISDNRVYTVQSVYALSQYSDHLDNPVKGVTLLYDIRTVPGKALQPVTLPYAISKIPGRAWDSVTLFYA